MKTIDLNLKQILKTTSFSLALSLSLFAQAEIRQSNQMQDILSEIDEDTLVIFDIDNTILRPIQTLGSDEWGSNQQARYKAQGLDSDSATDKGVSEFAFVQLKTKVQAVETSTPAIIRQIQTLGAQTMALTARPLNLVKRSQAQLASLGVNLKLTSPLREAFDLQSKAKAHYENGVLFVGPHNVKGEVLMQFLRESKLEKPRKIVFVDDKAHHVQSMEEATLKAQINYVGFRYGAADSLVKAFDEKIGDIEFQVFKATGKIISDQEAAALK